MSRAEIIIHGSADRERASRLIAAVPAGTRVAFRGSRRSLDQNAKMWAMLTEVSRQLEWHGQKLRPDDWKLIFLDALDREVRTVPSISGEGVVSLGKSTSDLSKNEMAELIELIYALGAEHSVTFFDPEAAFA
jgi:hypothetical protein